MTFPEQLKAHREKLGLTQAELAAVLEVSPRTIWKWLNGELPHILTQEAALARLAKSAIYRLRDSYNMRNSRCQSHQTTHKPHEIH